MRFKHAGLLLWPYSAVQALLKDPSLPVPTRAEFIWGETRQRIRWKKLFCCEYEGRLKRDEYEERLFFIFFQSAAWSPRVTAPREEIKEEQGGRDNEEQLIDKLLYCH